MKKTFILNLIIFFTGSIIFAQQPDTIVIYKTVDSIDLSIHIFFPKKHKFEKKTPAIVFFHGGGWKQGSPNHFYEQSEYLASRGLVCLNVQYRTEKANGTTPIECVKDGKSAMRWVKIHAEELGIDPEKIIASGGSAGGHIAAAMATVKGFNQEGEDTTVSCKPKALVLFNPVANNSKEGYGFPRVKDYWKEFSPAHNLDKTTPPTLIMLGTKDKLFKPELANRYKHKMEELGVRCDLILYEDQEHAFFNKDKNFELHYQTMIDADKFLISLGYLKGKPAKLKRLIKKYGE